MKCMNEKTTDNTFHRAEFEYANPLSYKLMQSHAKSMRFEMTNAEKCLWQCLRAKQLGVTFRRQYVISDYVADFVCLKKILIIEADGRIHSRGEVKQHDELRTEDLYNMGFKILRFTNDPIINDTETVLKRIKSAIQ